MTNRQERPPIWLPGMQRKVSQDQRAEAYAHIADAGKRFLGNALARYLINQTEYGDVRVGVPDGHRSDVAAFSRAEQLEVARWVNYDAIERFVIEPDILRVGEDIYRCQALVDRTGTLDDVLDRRLRDRIPSHNFYPSLHPGIVCMSIESERSEGNNVQRLIVAAMINELIKTGKWNPVAYKQATDRKTGKTEAVTSYDQFAGYKGNSEEYEAWLRSLSPDLDLLLPPKSKFLSIASNQIEEEVARRHFQLYGKAVEAYTRMWRL